MTTDIVTLAKRIATRAHKGQFRRDGKTPYIKHPALVAKLVQDSFNETRAVAWLHDVIEDTDETVHSLLDAGVPDFVVRTVSDLSNSANLKYHDYIMEIRNESKYPGIAIPVKIADIVANLSDDPTPVQVEKYYRALVALLK
jgi:(p)ppGpp synthase/HD superfamily hydrolase